MGSPRRQLQEGKIARQRARLPVILESELASQQASDVASQQPRSNKSTGFALVRAHSCHPPSFVYILTDNEG
jgi:hypothetical protein